MISKAKHPLHNKLDIPLRVEEKKSKKKGEGVKTETSGEVKKKGHPKGRNKSGEQRAKKLVNIFLSYFSFR